MIPKTIIHLLSGGLDSTTMLYDLQAQGHKLHCLLFDYKQRHAQELLWAKEHASRLGVLYTTMELPQLGGLTEQSWIVPNRNAIFLSVAVNVACQAGADTVTIGGNSEDAGYFPDCREPFIKAMNEAVKAAGYDVEICAPYLQRSKSWIARLASDLKVKANTIWTCYQPTPQGACGKCPACEKLAAAIQ